MSGTGGTISIVGAGQVGTMLGLALRAAGSAPLLFDRDTHVAQRSLARGAGARVAASLEDALACETVVLALPVSAIVATVRSHGDAFRAGGLVIDTGSAKTHVVEAMRRLPEGVHAIGGHPLAGTERAGPEGADVAALRDAPFVLCPVREDPDALARARALVGRVGARAVVMDAAEHDAAVARTSALPHLLAFALASATRDTPKELASTGYRGAVRLAQSDPRMVASFVAANAPEVRAALAELGTALGRLGDLLEDESALASALAEVRS